MSLVSTASDSSSRSCRHSAATSAVLPEPTGPPMPMRSGSPGVADPARAVGVAVRLAVDEDVVAWLAFQETYVKRRTAVGRVRRAAGRARRAADRTGRRVPWRPRRRSARTAADSSNVTAATSPGSSASRRCAAVAEPVIVVYTSDSAVCSGARPLAAADHARGHGEVRFGAERRPSRRSGHTRRASRSSPRPCAARRGARRGSRCAGIGFARRRRRAVERARVHGGRDRRGDQAVGADAAAQERPQCRRGRRPGRW